MCRIGQWTVVKKCDCCAVCQEELLQSDTLRLSENGFGFRFFPGKIMKDLHFGFD